LIDEREEIDMYVKRVGGRLHTVELNVKTVRDSAQEESMHQVNIFIDKLISDSEPMCSRQKCQQFLYSCGTTDIKKIHEEGASTTDIQETVAIDKKFENALLGCTLDDQKIVRKRLQALLTYLVKQSISD
jgi:BCL2-associated athanogene 2